MSTTSIPTDPSNGMSGRVRAPNPRVSVPSPVRVQPLRSENNRIPLEAIVPPQIADGNVLTTPVVDLSATNPVARTRVVWGGMAAESIESTGCNKIECRFRGPMHLLAVYDHGSRRDGETLVQGCQRSTVRGLARKLTLVPAGHDFHERLETTTLARLMYFYFDPARFLGTVGNFITNGPLAPRIFFNDPTLFNTALKLKRAVENQDSRSKAYSEAVATVLLHEVACLISSSTQPTTVRRSGLAPWQQRAVTSYIEDRLGEQIPLAKLAELVRLNKHHFCHAFRQSLGMPPHRYHVTRRIERAKILLADRSISVTEIGTAMGYSETSAFTVAFRTVTGRTPTEFRRDLEVA